MATLFAVQLQFQGKSYIGASPSGGLLFQPRPEPLFDDVTRIKQREDFVVNVVEIPDTIEAVKELLAETTVDFINTPGGRFCVALMKAALPVVVAKTKGP